MNHESKDELNRLRSFSMKICLPEKSRVTNFKSKIQNMFTVLEVKLLSYPWQKFIQNVSPYCLCEYLSCYTVSNNKTSHTHK
ncbi:hypothetical protein CDL12_08887 [Handroanthus impetiginosus]|uniref:Uncharacterized protein n=1 Tax=Handroanthus impetiginosus TaxID=429701 RepID=A0A2G9HMB6_9LAMI|nr:hypothetical protein CDL12_08887 [Handroanthus impetiginosus]